MKLDDTFSIKNSSGNVVLIEVIDGFNWNKDHTKKIPAKSTKEYYYGSLAQALNGYLRLSVDNAPSIKDARKIAIKVIETLEQLEQEIKDKFKTEVKTVKP